MGFMRSWKAFLAISPVSPFSWRRAMRTPFSFMNWSVWMAPFLVAASPLLAALKSR